MPKATIPIYHDDDFERLAELRREVTIAERKVETEKDRADDDTTTRRIGDDAGADDRLGAAREYLQQARDAFDAFVDEASERAEMWCLKPIGHEEFRGLLRAHPPRTITKGEGDEAEQVSHPDDDGWDVNTETFPKALLLFTDPDDDEIRTIVEPKFETEAAMRKRVKRLSAGEFASMWITAYQANNGAISDPKFQRFSPAGQRSDET